MQRRFQDKTMSLTQMRWSILSSQEFRTKDWSLQFTQSLQERWQCCSAQICWNAAKLTKTNWTLSSPQKKCTLMNSLCCSNNFTKPVRSWSQFSSLSSKMTKLQPTTCCLTYSARCTREVQMECPLAIWTSIWANSPLSRQFKSELCWLIFFPSNLTWTLLPSLSLKWDSSLAKTTIQIKWKLVFSRCWMEQTWSVMRPTLCQAKLRRMESTTSGLLQNWLKIKRLSMTFNTWTKTSKCLQVCWFSQVMADQCLKTASGFLWSQPRPKASKPTSSIKFLMTEN